MCSLKMGAGAGGEWGGDRQGATGTGPQRLTGRWERTGLEMDSSDSAPEQLPGTDTVGSSEAGLVLRTQETKHTKTQGCY